MSRNIDRSIVHAAYGVLLIFATSSMFIACGDDDDTTKDPHADVWVDDAEVPVGDDLTVIETEVDGTYYRCLYVYADGYQSGGPAMWCERLSR